MALTGTFEDISFAELLQLLNVGHKSGRLTVWRGSERAQIFITEGEVARAVSRRERGPEVVYRVLGWRSGEFTFERSDATVAREINETTEALILEGMKRFDEWQHFEAEMPDMEVVLRQRVFAVNERWESLSPQARVILPLVDAKRNVATLIRESGLDPTQALQAVTELLVEGIVEEWQPSGEEADVVVTRGKTPRTQGSIDLQAAPYPAPGQRKVQTGTGAGGAAGAKATAKQAADT
jgi:hypothetical protein